jgi:hypothetical protein
MVIEVLRVDEWPRGISALPPDDDPSVRIPLARGTSVGVVGRAWVIEHPGAQPIRDTGDVRRLEHYAVGSESTADAVQFSLAVRSAALKLGAALARRVLGEPAPTVEPL